MSLARWSKAYCHNQSTTCTTPWSLASSCLLALPSSTSCSKLPKPFWPPLLLAARTDLASAKNSAVKLLMACGLASTRRTFLRVWRCTSGTQSRMYGSAVATTTSVGLTCTGSTLWRSA
ncbi:hypothetical protein D9M68_972170 [compost metagenome]